MQPLITVVIPAFNEEETLPALFARLDQLAQRGSEYRWEFLFVNDGSRDRTEVLLKQQALRDPRVRAIHFSRNFGHQMAVTAGLDYASGDAVAVIDADLQDPPEAILEMAALWQQGHHVVYGQRRSREGESWFKRQSAALFYRTLARLTKENIPLDAGDFRLMDRQVVDVVRTLRESHRFVRGIVASVGFSSVPLVYDRHARFAGTTKYPLKKMLRFAADAILSFSNVPLRVASYLGWITTLLGMVGIAVIVGLKLFTDHTVPGISAVLVAIIFFGGVQLTMLGIMGEYIGRIFDETKRRPLYVVRECTNCDAAAPRLTGTTH